MLCCDDNFGELVADVLAHHEVDIISEYSLVSNLSDMNAIFQHDSYDLLILTNMGIPAAWVMKHLSLLPDIRTYRTLLFTGWVSDPMIDACERRDVKLVQCPVEIAEILTAVEGSATPSEPTRRQRTAG